uniref:Endo-1,4-beta-xylanase A n=1 Tax=uncultured bacterium contig00178 TaxID=1181600 RepID=A0A806KSM7_9BACT|nr:endo-1,4-beta-xylanase A precursor [uncultured bacterium contig00178]
MSYGMMIAVQLNKQTEFNKLWRWARQYMYNDRNGSGGVNRGYYKWACQTSGAAKDNNPAPDGEFYFATALLFAHARWGSASGSTDIMNYQLRARELLYDMCHRDWTNWTDGYDQAALFRRPGDHRTDNPVGSTHVRNNQPVFSPSGGSANHTDPSYHLPGFFEVWAMELEADAAANQLYGVWSSLAELQADAAFYRQCATKSRSFFQSATHGTTGLGPDYATYEGVGTGSQPDFQYDAFRIAMNIAFDYAWFVPSTWPKTHADRIQSFFANTNCTDCSGVYDYKALWQVNGTKRSDHGDHSPGLVACNAVASLAATNARAWQFLDDFWNISLTKGQYRYYDGTLYMLGLLHVTGNFKAYLRSNTTPVASASINPTSVTFDKYSSNANYGNKTITVTFPDTTYSLSSITNGGTTLTSGTNYTTSGSGTTRTVVIQSSYLSTLAVGSATLTFNFNKGNNQTLAVTINDSTPPSSISPTSGSFNATTSNTLQTTMTLQSGHSLSSITRNGTAVPTGSSGYTTNGNTITFTNNYLKTLPNGANVLTFNFSAGTPATYTITVSNSTVSGGGGTSYDFSTNPSISGISYVNANGSTTTGLTASVTGGVLLVERVTTNHDTLFFALPFELGSSTLASFTSLKIVIKGVSGDLGHKNVRVGILNGTTYTQFYDTQHNITTTALTITVPLTGRTETGSIKIAIGLNNASDYKYEIHSLTLGP